MFASLNAIILSLCLCVVMYHLSEFWYLCVVIYEANSVCQAQICVRLRVCVA